MRKRLFERRSEKFDPIHPRDPGLTSLFGGGNRTASGIIINEDTATTITAVYAAIKLISETIATLPWNVHVRNGKNLFLAVNDYRFELLHDRPNRWQDSLQFREMVIRQLLLKGRSVSELVFANGRITDILPLQPGSYVPFFTPDGSIAFDVQNAVGGRRILLSDEVLDLRGAPDTTRPEFCLSPIAENAETLGISRAADNYAGSFFGNGTVVSGVLETDNELSDNAYKRLKAWTERHQGIGRQHNPAILEEGLKWQQTSLNAEDSQLIETRKYQVDDIARIYRIPSYKLGSMDRANFNNVEQQSIDFSTDTIVPNTVRIERATQTALFTRAERRTFFNKIDINELMRGDSKSRGEFYKLMWGMGAYSPNDILAKENENPVEHGDRRFVPVNFIPLDRVDEIGSQPDDTDNTDNVDDTDNTDNVDEEGGDSDE